MDNEGPTVTPAHKVQVPESTSCFGCKYHLHQMRKSGRNPEYNDNCSHPEAYEDEMMRRFGHRSLPGSSWLGVDSHPTPTWCPFLRKPTTPTAGDE